MAAVFLVSSCADLDHAAPGLPALDAESFEAEVQDILIQRCSNPTTCHGDETRPWVIYAPGANRLDPADTFYDFTLTAEETQANFERTRPFAVDWGCGPELLTKPLARRLSGVRHEGGDIFSSTQDREYRTIERWVQGRSNAVEE